ncbi:hypothetical protein Leryth_027501 [Lithospermum erythrorhizon]|uniref:DNA-binding transcription factor n=1 Tax=Lithospermum erythrorhizon TaxID=34254 RepID=A0AAV3Q7X7_LITER|nr:hypothetical protein Leryth_027501 [Lithospermum erythrorhizon]
MMASPTELSLDCKQHQSYSMLLKSFGEHNNTNDHHSHKLEEFLARLEEERLKIDAFKRELPLCMQLLTNAVETYKQQLQSFRTPTTTTTNCQSTKPILEEFIPLKNGNFEGSSEKVTINMNMPDNKENWMTSAQLWVQTAPTDHEKGTNQQQPTILTKPSSPKEETHQKRNNGEGGGAFLPFQQERRTLPELGLASSDDKENEDKMIIPSVHHQAELGKGESQSTIINNHTTQTNTTQTQRKARRCWSPDLHRRFVNALQMLGGSQVATPKQIRELMKVDGLTNDEVKSHLQKYRLHTRRPISPNPQTSVSAGTPQLVVLGGIWVPPEYATAAAHGGAPPTLYGAHPSTHHHATSHYCGTPQMVPQDFYSSHQMHMFRPTPTTQALGSPESGGHGRRSESIEDGKSESSGWKADSGGENGLEMKAMVLRDGEETNESEITLKF